MELITHEKKTEIISFRVTPTTRAKLKQVADKKDIPQAVVVSQMIDYVHKYYGLLHKEGEYDKA